MWTNRPEILQLESWDMKSHIVPPVVTIIGHTQGKKAEGAGPHVNKNEQKRQSWKNYTEKGNDERATWILFPVFWCCISQNTPGYTTSGEGKQ